MGNLLRMDLYRLIRSKSLYICLAIICAFSVLGVVTIWYANTPEFAELMTTSQYIAEDGASVAFTMDESVSSADYSTLTLQRLFGSIFVSGGLLTLLVSLSLVLFVGAEFDSGFVKNVLAARRGRGAYFASKTVLAVIFALIFVLAASLVSLIGAIFVGVEIAFSAAEFFSWVSLLILAVAAYATISLFFVMFTKSKTAGILAACMLSSSLLGLVASGIIGMFPNLVFLLDYTVYSGYQLLAIGLVSSESLGTVHIALVAGAYFVAFAALSYIGIRKKDI